jgi:hypothetical protein
MFKTFARFIAPSGMPAPVLWGDETVVRQRRVTEFPTLR